MTSTDGGRSSALGRRAVERRLGLVTDLYELTMAASYHRLGMHDRATFSLFVRKLPAHRSFLVAAGLEDALARLERLGFDDEGIDYLVTTGHVRPEEADALARVRFTGDVRAVREGRVVFPGEPLVEVDAPIIEAQLAESLILNAIHYPTLVATKAARCVAVAGGRPLVDFGLRRTPGIDASVDVARACWLAGFASTSNVHAARRLGIPASGTVAHAFIEAMPDERAAFEAWARTTVGPLTLLVDTYDTLSGTRRAIELARRLRGEGRALASLRLDSGDLEALSRAVRQLLDDAGLRDVRIFASGGLDEYAIDRLVRARAPIDGFGVGTRVGMSADAPVLDMAYKIVAYAGRPCLKLSAGKATIVGPKQVWRRRDSGGRLVADRIAALDEPAPTSGDWEPLLEPVVSDGRALRRPRLAELRSAHAAEVARLPAELRAIAPDEPRATYAVSISRVLAERHRAAVRETRRREGLEPHRDGQAS